MFGIATSGGRRGQTDLDRRVKAAIYAVASLTAGTLCGVALGLLGSSISESARVTAASVAAVVLAGVGLAQLRPDSRLSIWERDCETAQTWMEHGPITWAVMNGSALGAGFVSRIGFISWYVVPIASLLFGNPLLGAVIYGLYGGARGFAVLGWIIGLRMAGGDTDDRMDVVLGFSTLGKRLSAALLVAFATATIVVAGV